MKLDIPCILAQLAQRRPIFHSEADFQHELAWEIRTCHPCVQIRLEVPFNIGESGNHGQGPARGALDILIRSCGSKMALELKYMCASLWHEIAGESFGLKNQGAHDIRCYDVWKDVMRMERFVRDHKNASAAVIALTNDPKYWNGPNKNDAYYAQFCLRDNRSVSGALDWDKRTGHGTKKGRDKVIALKYNYRILWKDYYDIGNGKKYGKFRYIYLHVPPF